MNIIKQGFKFTGLTPVAKTKKKYIVTHHPAARVYSPEQIHKQHTNQGWGGAGYNFYIRKDGSVYELRPTLTWGAHCNKNNKNEDGIGVCWEGNWDIETIMSKEQFQAGVQLYRYIMKEYNIPLANVSRHLDYKPTSCPGRNFPWKALLDELRKPVQEFTLIQGATTITKEEAYKHINDTNNNCQLTVKLSELIDYYFETCSKYNIRTEVALSQAVHETNYFRYGGIVLYSQNNFAGIGAIDGNQSGQAATFKTAIEGVIAHVQHLFAYASIEPVKEPILDPRFHLVKRGSAPTLEYLSIPNNPAGFGWATDKDYASKIIRIINKVNNTKVEHQHWGVPLINGLIERGIVKEFHNSTDMVTWAEFAAVTLNQHKLILQDIEEIKKELKGLKNVKAKQG